MPNKIVKNKKQYMLGGQGAPNSKAGDETALEALYSSTNGASWTDNTGWASSGMDLSNTIYGVTTATIDGELRVTELNLLRNNLVGTLPPKIGNLRELTYLNIKQPLTETEWNQDPQPDKIIGEIPPELGNLTKLTWLSLSGQYGDIEIDDTAWNSYNHGTGHSTGGKRVVGGNKFTGNIPPELGNLVSLELMEIRQHNLTGSIPASFGNLTSLQALFLDGMGDYNPDAPALDGTIPPELGDIGPSLRHLHLTRNKFTGDIPNELGNLPNLTNLRLSWNPTFNAGPIPDWSAYDTNFYAFYMEDCNRNGDFPKYFFQDNRNPNLDSFKISWNNVGGELPSTNVNPDTYWSLSVLGLNGNEITGPIPNWITGLQVKLFNMGWNDFTGDLPAGFHDSNSKIWTQLRNMRLNNNNLTGQVPQANPGPSIYFWHVHNNSFTGTLPVELGSTTSDRSVQILANDNNLSEQLPTEIANITNLAEIDVSYNSLSQSDIDPLLNTLDSSVTFNYSNQSV